jgi:HlyD family secretion protein
VGEKPLLTPKGKWAIAVAIALSLGLLAAGIFRVLNRSQVNKPESAATPKINTPAKISALGRIEPEGEVTKVGGPSGERIKQLLVKEGQFVRQGQPLVILESYDERLADEDVAESELQDAITRLVSVKQFRQAQVAEAKTRQSQADLPKRQELAEQAATINRLKAELAQTDADAARFKKLQDQGVISLKELEDRRLEQRRAQESLRVAQEQLKRINQELKTDVENANAQLKSAEAEKLQSQAEIAIQTARSKLNLAKTRVARTVIRAPRSGQVIKVITRSGEALEMAAGSDSTERGILELANTSQMSVVAEVYETDVSRVKKGQLAELTSPAFSGTLRGTVERVGLKIGKNDVVATDPAANTDTRVVEVRIRLKDSRPVAGLTNLQVAVSINPSR